MFRTKKHLSAKMAFGLLATSLFAMTAAQAADHQEAPATQAQTVADIGDYYVWHEGEQLNLILTFGTFSAPGTPAAYDSNILYTLNFDTSETPDGVSDVALHARFAQDADGNWGVQVMGDGVATLEGAVETVMSNDDMSVWAGLSDDPFFFDLTGFTETVTTGTLAFNPERDDVAGLNITSVAIQLPVATIGAKFQTWATTNSK